MYRIKLISKILRRILFIIATLTCLGFTQKEAEPSFEIAKLKYNGGGDWYANKTSLPNLIKFCNDNHQMNISPQEKVVEVGSAKLFNFPFVHMTGHGNVSFSNDEAQNLRNYMVAGGFLHIDDNYGLDKFIRLEIKKVFPELDFIELPFDHAIYHQAYDFDKGLPKIHEHDGKPAQGFGLIYEGRLVCFYSYECDLGNGWEDQEVYNDDPKKRTQALQMGANILTYALSNQ